MKIKKILNNNVLIVSDEQKQEHIVVGRGIGFSKQKGDCIDEDKIDRIFSSDQNKSNRLLELIKEIPEAYLSIAEEIIEYAESILDKKLSDSIYITLTDHINFIKTRYDRGLMPNNPLKWEIQRYYKKEYVIAKKAVQLLEEELEITLNTDEIASIAMHIVNAEDDVDMRQNMKTLTLMDDIMQVVQYQTHQQFDEDSINYQRLITHLKFFIHRIQANEQYNQINPLYEIVKKNYPQAYECVIRIQELVEKKTKYKVSHDELTYLTIHVQRIVERK